MRICKSYQVKFKGKLINVGSPAQVSYWIVDDDGKRFEVSIPNHPKIIEAFEWMDANDCLRHLQNISPSYTTNHLEVETIQHYNAMLEENSYSIPKQYCVSTGSYRAHVPGRKKVPERMFEATWTFWSKEHAVMFKLACGGDLED
jgi:hypothetical protein